MSKPGFGEGVRCIACANPINHAARICPYCRLDPFTGRQPAMLAPDYGTEDSDPWEAGPLALFGVAGWIAFHIGSAWCWPLWAIAVVCGWRFLRKIFA